MGTIKVDYVIKFMLLFLKVHDLSRLIYYRDSIQLYYTVCSSRLITDYVHLDGGKSC